MRFVEAERADAQAPQLAEVGASAERGAEICRQCPHVGPTRAVDPDRRLRVGAAHEILDLDCRHRDVPGRALDRLPRPGELVELAAVDLDRRHHRRDLIDLTDERARGARHLLLNEWHLGPLEHRARRVEV